MTNQKLTLVELNDDNLAHLPASVEYPQYDRTKLTAGILHIGVGNFHRAHQAWYLHQMIQNGRAQDWAIVGAGVRTYDEMQRTKLEAQDYLTTLVELDPSRISAEVIGSMIDYVPIEPNNQSLIARMAHADIRIVSLTVTESGYYICPNTTGFDSTHPDILFDKANPQTPKTAFGAIIAALKIRRDQDMGSFACMSCDNLQNNGLILKQTVLSLARLSDPELADWIEVSCSFPNSMVDCIVPATGPKELELVQSLGIDDKVPVAHESFRQWVIEDVFCAGRPEWETVGATLTDNVHDYEAMKIRILNGGHQIIAAPGEILSIETIAECLDNDKIRALFIKIAGEEIAPHVNAVPTMNTNDYIKLVDRRFSNPRIIDTTRRVAFDGSSRHPGFLIPSIRDGISASTSIDGLALIEAAWARMCEGSREDGSQIMPNDPNWDALQLMAKRSRNDPMAWIEQRQYYGDLVDNPIFATAFTKWLALIWDSGIEAAINTFLAS